MHFAYKELHHSQFLNLLAGIFCNSLWVHIGKLNKVTKATF